MDTQSANTSQQESAQPQGDQAEQGEQTQKQQEPNTKIGTFEPKYEVHIDPPKDEGYTAERLAEFDGTGADGRVFVAIKVSLPHLYFMQCSAQLLSTHPRHLISLRSIIHARTIFSESCNMPADSHI